MSVWGEFAAIISLAAIAGVSAHWLALQLPSRPHVLTGHLGTIPWNRMADYMLLGLAIVSAAAIIAHVTVLYYSFRNGTRDLALFDQVVWNSLNGRPFETTLLPNNTPSQLGNHFSLSLMAVVPLYAVISDPFFLRAVQALSLVGMVFPLYWFARPRIGHLLALTLGAAYLISPLLAGVNLYDFHEISLATTPLGLALYFLYRRRDVPFLISAFLAMMAKEDVSIIIAGLGIFVLVVQRRLGFGLLVSGIGMAWLVIVVQGIMPRFSPAGMWLGVLYPDLGKNLFEMAWTVITRPLFILQLLMVPEKVEFVLHLFVPLAFVPLLGLELTALAAIPMFESLLGGSEIMYRPFTWYAASMVPFVFFGAVLGLERLLAFQPISKHVTQAAVQHLAARKAALAALLLTASIAAYYLYSPLPFARKFNLDWVLPNAHGAAGQQLLQELPRDSVVSVPDEAMPHVSQRKLLYVFPSYPDYRQVEYLFGDTRGYWFNFHKRDWDEVLSNGYFTVVKESDGFLLAKRTPLEHQLGINYGDRISLLGYTVPVTTTLRGGQTLRPIVGWRAEQNIPRKYAMRMALLDAAGHFLAIDDREPQDGHLPTDTWIQGQYVGDQFSLNLPIAMPPGEYSITLGVYDVETGRSLVPDDSEANSLAHGVSLGTARIEKNKSSMTATELQNQWQLENPYFVDMAEIRLIGFKPLLETMSRGQLLPVGLYWRAREKPQGDYEVIVRLLDRSSRVVAEQESRPANGAYPTMAWDAGEIVLDWHDLQVPANLGPGEYKIQVSLVSAGDRGILGETLLPVTPK